MAELRLPIGTYNNGNARDAVLLKDWNRLLDRHPVALYGCQETADRDAVMSALEAEVLRLKGDSRGRLALVLDGGIDYADWGYWMLNVGGERVEKTVAGSADGTAERKYILWADVHDTLIGTTHLIPSTARRTPLGAWKHPMAREVYKTQVAGCVEWFANGGDVLMGDMNGEPDYSLLEPLRQVAACYSLPTYGDDREIDHIWIRNGSGLMIEDLLALTGYSSDHKPLVATLVIPVTVPPNVRAARRIRRAAQDPMMPAVREEMLNAAQALEDGRV